MIEKIFGGSEFERLVSRERELTARKRTAVAALTVAREAAGVALVGGEAGPELAAVTRLVEETTAAGRAIGLVRGRRAAAITAENRAAADRLRAEAANGERELSGLMVKVGKLLADLGKLEGVVFDPASLILAASGPVRSGNLVDQIRDLHAKAENLESACVPNSGHFDGDGITDDAEVIAGVLRHRSDGPTAEAVAEWLAACANNNRVLGRSFGSLPRRVYLKWTGGVIDTGASYVFVPSLAKRATGRGRSDGSVNPGESEFFDVKSGEFRAAA